MAYLSPHLESEITPCSTCGGDRLVQNARGQYEICDTCKGVGYLSDSKVEDNYNPFNIRDTDDTSFGSLDNTPGGPTLFL